MKRTLSEHPEVTREESMPNQDPLQLIRENAFPSLAREKRNFCSAQLAIPGNLSCTHLRLLTSVLEEETRGGGALKVNPSPSRLDSSSYLCEHI